MDLARSMGLRNVLFRSLYELERKSGFLKWKYPSGQRYIANISLGEWRKSARPFFFLGRRSLALANSPNSKLESEANNVLKGKIRLFRGEQFDLGHQYDWMTNPTNGYRYDEKLHWTEIQDLESSSGDIKYIWEKSRFCHFYAIIRFDYAANIDSSDFIFNEIISRIEANPLNQGPNYVSSQEICLRILNWTFALYYYRDSNHLTESAFSRIIDSIHGQLVHVYRNIDFSRIAVRNNHALTETLTLYLAGLLFPFIPDAEKWKTKGKKWFEEEVEYQIYPDGTYLQFSMNYHRVVVQLLTWAFILAKANEEKFSEITYERARNTLTFLLECQDQRTGRLPNYGANDGSLFFKLNNCDYRDFRPQLSALAYALYGKGLYEEGPWDEDMGWYTGIRPTNIPRLARKQDSVGQFEDGGFYVMRDLDSITFIRCGKHKDRPSQADNLHLDLWYNGNNILRDAGSYSYNTSPEVMRYFVGTQSHNTVMLGEFDQMQKGPRFIWLRWSQAIQAKVRETEDAFEFEGSIRAFQHVAKDIVHTRKVRKLKNVLSWEICDVVEHRTELPMNQIWNIGEGFEDGFEISARDESNVPLEPQTREAWFSETYGLKVPSRQIIFSSPGKKISTVIVARGEKK
jgi:hypothetical protein